VILLEAALNVRSGKIHRVFEIVARMKYKNDPDYLSLALDEAMELWLNANTGDIRILRTSP
jgi:hypothetical protein